MMRNFVAAFAVLGALFAPVKDARAEEAIILGCITSNPSSKDWVPKGILLEFARGAQKAAVIDDFTLKAFDGPVFADVTWPSRNRVQLDWKITGIRDRTDKVQNVRFKMSINLKRGSFTYSGVGASFFQPPGTAEGKCAAQKVKKR